MIRKFLKKILPSRNDPLKRHKAARKITGQSLVELAIAFPVIILLFSGLIEFGFILNYYLSLLDATRESARWFSQQDPFTNPMTDPPTLNMDYYNGAISMVLSNLQPFDLAHPELDSTRKVILDPDTDDVIISVFNIEGTTTKTVTRYPPSGKCWFCKHSSGVSDADITNKLISGSKPTAILLVEVYYDYHQILALPWLAPFLSDPVVLHAYTMMPMPPISLANQTPAVFTLSFAPWEK
jgi:hypothetical protein